MVDMNAVYETWKNSFGSVNTIKKYTSSVLLYCDLVFKKQPSEITIDDLCNLNYGDTINKFVNVLRQRGVKDSTIKSHLTAMRSFVKMMRREKVFEGLNYGELTANVLTVDNLSTRDIEHHAAISREELHEMENWLRTEEKLPRYAWLIDFMYCTAVRVTAALSIHWSDFEIMSSPYGGTWSKLEVIDKGRKLNTKYLAQEYFVKMKRDLFNGKENGLVFEGLTQNELRRLFKQFSKKIGRNLVIHSLKAGAATTLYAETKDLLRVRDFCDHASVKTTEAYIHREKDPNQSGGAFFTMPYDKKAIDQLSKEQLLVLIHSKSEREHEFYLDGKELGIIE